MEHPDTQQRGIYGHVDGGKDLSRWPIRPKKDCDHPRRDPGALSASPRVCLLLLTHSMQVKEERPIVA